MLSREIFKSGTRYPPSKGSSAGCDEDVSELWKMEDAVSSSSFSESESVSYMIDTKETVNLPPVFPFVFFALVVVTKGFDVLGAITKGA